MPQRLNVVFICRSTVTLYQSQGHQKNEHQHNKRLQSQDHVKKKWPTNVASLMLDACLVVKIVQHRTFAFADPL